LYITAPFIVSMGARTSSGFAPGDFIERSIQATRGENLAGFYLFSTIPPEVILIIEDILWGGFRLFLGGLFLVLN
jgi:hypothetical protein